MKFKRLVEKVSEDDYSVMDHTLAKAERFHDTKVDAYENKVKELKLQSPDEKRDAHQDIKTNELKKMHLTESIFSEWVEDTTDIITEDIDAEPVSSKLLDAIDEGILDARSVVLACVKWMSEDDVEEMIKANDLMDLQAEDDEDAEDILDEGIDSNKSHADEFVKALRSAGFGDGFDQKLKIDQYETGTRIEYEDQGGHFIVTITEDKVVLEGQDEGSEAFKEEFTTWADFAKAFDDLYPGVPVHENKTLVEARKIPAMINNYEREDGARYLVYAEREPLAYVIEAELTSGEICYLDKNGHIAQSVMPHKDYPVKQVTVQWDEWEMPFVKVWGPNKEYFDAAIEVANKYGKDYEIHLDKYVKGPNKFWLEIILTDEDTEEPYYDPEAPVYSAVELAKRYGKNSDGAEMTGRHMKDNEDLEDSQRYPIESPAPAQTGLAMMESNESLTEDVMMNGALNEVRISTEGIRNFKPWDGAVTTFNNILEAGKMDQFERQLEEEYPEGIGSTELNDMLWFDADYIYNRLGMTDHLESEEE